MNSRIILKSVVVTLMKLAILVLAASCAGTKDRVDGEVQAQYTPANGEVVVTARLGYNLDNPSDSLKSLSNQMPVVNTVQPVDSGECYNGDQSMWDSLAIEPMAGGLKELLDTLSSAARAHRELRSSLEVVLSAANYGGDFCDWKPLVEKYRVFEKIRRALTTPPVATPDTSSVSSTPVPPNVE